MLILLIMIESKLNNNSFRNYLFNNNGHILLNTDYESTTYYNNHVLKFNDKEKEAMLRLVKMQKIDPVQYMLSVKALLD